MTRKLLRPSTPQIAWRVRNALCLWCGEPRPTRQTFCSRSCSVSMQNSDRAVEARRRKRTLS